MSTPKFTPGPWVAGADGADVCPSAGEKQHVELAHIVGPWSDSSWFGSEEARANAHLIAAAPDLYEALERAVRYFTDAGSNREAWGEMVHEWQQTLAKARGETP